MPEFLDHLGKIYLFNQAKNKIELDEINKKIKTIKQELLNKGLFNEPNRKDLTKKENFYTSNKSETENSIIMNNLSKDYSEYENNNNKNLILIVNKNKDNIQNSNSKNLNKKLDLKINKFNLTKSKNYNTRNLSTNYSNCLDKNNSSNSDINSKQIEIINFKNGGMSYSSANSTNYKIFKKYQKKENLLSEDIIPDVIKLNDFKKILNQKNNESKFQNNNIYNLIAKFLKLNKKLKELKKNQEEMRKNEMDRIFNEYLRNNYFQKYKVEKNIVLSALIGEDNINTELNKQIKRAKKFFDNAKSYSLGHKRINKKFYKFDKDNQIKLKNLVGDTFLGGGFY